MSSSLIIRHARNSGTTIIGGGGGIGFQTLALLNADLAHDENTLAEVTNDAPNNGTYIKVGASGAGSWLKSTNDVSGRVTDLETNAVLNVGGEVQDDTSFGGKLTAPGNDLSTGDEVVTRVLGDARWVKKSRGLNIQTLAYRSTELLAGNAAPRKDLYPLTLSQNDFEALTEYEERIYDVVGVGRYHGGKKLMCDPWSYDPSDIHVTKAGNDITGDGTVGNPYLTINKGFDVAVAANGGTVWVHEGVYSENASGGYFLKTNVSPSSQVIIRARPDQNVTMTHESGSYLLRFNGACSNITFHGFEFKARNSSVVGFFFCGSIGASADNFEFIECYFNDDQATAGSINMTATGGATGFKVKRCKFVSNSNMSTLFGNCVGLTFIGNAFICPNSNSSFIAARINTGNSGTFYINSNYIKCGNSSAAGVIAQDVASTSEMTIICNGNTIKTNGVAIRFVGGSPVFPASITANNNVIEASTVGITCVEHVTGGSVSGNRVRSSGTIGIGWPGDSASTGLVTGVNIEDNHLTSTGGAVNHALLIGANSSNIIATNNYIDGSLGAYGIVLKGTNNTLNYNVVFGGSENCIYLKGSDGSQVSNNSFYQSVPSGNGALAFAVGSFGELQKNCVVKNNVFYNSASDLYDVLLSELDVNNVVDANVYLISGTGTWGSMFGGVVNNLAEVRSSWSTNYGSSLNDLTSSDN